MKKWTRKGKRWQNHCGQVWEWKSEPRMSDERTYKIGEVGEMLAIKPYVLRYWETEFPQLVPLRSEKGMRLYTEEQVAILRRIQYLLHEKGMKIEGARQILEEDEKPEDPENSEADFIQMIRNELTGVRNILAASERSAQ